MPALTEHARRDARRMMRGAGPLALLALTAAAPDRAPDPLRTVDPLIGTDWYGYAFVGATLPFGMVKLGPDMAGFDGTPSKYGYRRDGRVLGFSHLHLSGAAGKYGNVRVMPASGPLDMADIASARTDETARPGYYAATLVRSGVRAELTADARAGVHRYTFRKDEPAHLTVRLDQMLNKRGGKEDQRFLGGTISTPSSHEIDGIGRYAGGWNMGAEYKVYFALLADRDGTAVRTWKDGVLSTDREASVAGDLPLGATLDFPAKAGQVVTARVGISFVGVEQARRNALAAGGFEATRAVADRAWRRALSPIRVTGGTETERRQFYTALYHVMMMPTDHSGENPNWRSTEPYYDDFYTIWDTFRTNGPLLTLIAPDRERDLVRSLIDVYRHEGWLPDGRSGDSTGRTQGGSNADVMIADAYVKGLRGIDYATALAGMEKNASVEPDRPDQYGRGGISDYLSKGYISTGTPRAGSRTVEYAYDDFALAELACGLGKPDVGRAALKRSGNWANLWDDGLSREGVSGFLRPRKPDGGWADPYLVTRGTWPDFLYEGDIWTYSLYAPHDVPGLIAKSGGRDAFVRRLDTLFDHLHFDMTNEPGFLIPMLYHWVGRPDRSVERLIDYREKAFFDGRGGLPANDDSGAMSSWLVFQMLGLFPVAGQDLYLIGSPVFTGSDLDLGNGHVLHIRAPGLGAGGANPFVQSAELNGHPIDRAWLRHGEIAQGGTLVLHMGPEPTDWGRRDLPPAGLSATCR